MSPLKINILMHYYACTNDYKARFLATEAEHANSPAVAEALQCFVDNGLLTSYFGDVPWCIRQDPREYNEVLFSITDKGRAMVAHLMEVEVPVCKWVRPEETI